MTKAATRLFSLALPALLALSLLGLGGCSTQQKLFGKPSSSTAWQSAYEEKEKSPDAGTATAAAAEEKRPITGDNTRYFIQLAAYTSRANAEAQLKKMKKALKQPVVIFEEQDNGTRFYKLQVGPFKSLQEAVLAEPGIREAGFEKIRYIRRY